MDFQLFQGKDGGADGDRTHDLLTASQVPYIDLPPCNEYVTDFAKKIKKSTGYQY